MRDRNSTATVARATIAGRKLGIRQPPRLRRFWRAWRKANNPFSPALSLLLLRKQEA